MRFIMPRNEPEDVYENVHFNPEEGVCGRVQAFLFLFKNRQCLNIIRAQCA